MKLSIWRDSFKAFVNRYIVIQGYGVAEPDAYGIFMAHLPPLHSVSYARTPPDIATGTGIQDLYILSRYPGATPYNELPISQLEGLHCTLAMHLELEYSRLTDPAIPNVPLLQTAQTLKTDYPIKVEELSYANKDWLIVQSLSWGIQWIAEPEVAINKTLLTGLDLGVYRSTLANIADASLDWQVTL